MKKFLHGIADILTGQRQLRDVLSFILGGITTLIGAMILMHTPIIYHSLAGLAIFLAGLAHIVIAVVPIKKWRMIEMISFVVVIYGLTKSQSIVAMSVGFYSMIFTIFGLGLWINVYDWLTKKRGE